MSGQRDRAFERQGSADEDALPHVTELLAQKIATLNRALDRQAEGIVAERADMTLLECRILAYIEVYGPIGVGDLAAGMFIDGGQTSRLTSKLVALGYVARTRNSGDQRSVSLSLTPRGREVYIRMQRSVVRWNKVLTAQLGREELRVLDRALDRLTAFIAGYGKTRHTS